MSKSDVYEIVTEQVIESLENGVMPWNRPWVAATVMPTNAATERPYSGVNILLLWAGSSREGLRFALLGDVQASPEDGRTSP